MAKKTVKSKTTRKSNAKGGTARGASRAKAAPPAKTRVKAGLSVSSKPARTSGAVTPPSTDIRRAFKTKLLAGYLGSK